MHLSQAEIISNICIAKEIYSMLLLAPDIARDARPGQFTMFYLDRGELLLPRPISFCDTNRKSGTVTLVYRVVGAGTEEMSRMCPGRRVRLLGPLGNGFTTEGIGTSKAALVAGGIGAPPLYFLAKKLAEDGIGFDVFLGSRDEPILIEQFKAVADRLFVTTENGSFGHSGQITELLNNASDCGYFFGCGPKPLLTALSDFAAKNNIKHQICLEERMACGLGTCVGCVVEVEGKYVRVCSEGPVFQNLRF